MCLPGGLANGRITGWTTGAESSNASSNTDRRGRMPSEPCAQVRILLGAPHRSSPFLVATVAGAGWAWFAGWCARRRQPSRRRGGSAFVGMLARSTGVTGDHLALVRLPHHLPAALPPPLHP